MRDKLQTIYCRLAKRYGNPDWWPAKSPYEVMVGAVLTQNTNWKNVEKALEQFPNDIYPEEVMQLTQEELEERIRPAGFYHQKASCIKDLTAWYLNYEEKETPTLREELLAIKGIGQETADAILLYAFNRPVFIADTYARRFFERFPIPAGNTYAKVKTCVEKQLDKTADFYNKFHALIILNGKAHCGKKKQCAGCPLEDMCEKI